MKQNPRLEMTDAGTSEGGLIDSFPTLISMALATRPSVLGTRHGHAQDRYAWRGGENQVR